MVTNHKTFQIATWLVIVLIFAPILWGGIEIFLPAFSIKNWQLLFSDQRTLTSLALSLGSAALSTIIALFAALTLTVHYYQHRYWQFLQSKLTMLLAFPHVSFAIGFAFLLAPTGLIARMIAHLINQVVPVDWVIIQDPFAISLTIALAIKETWFLLWVILAVLKREQVSKKLTIAKSFGYRSQKIWLFILIPELLPYLGWPLLAVFAYGLSVVDMSIILGPTTPKTLAVLSWQWMLDMSQETQIKGSLSALLLCAILAITVWIGRLIFAMIKHKLNHFNGSRRHYLLPKFYIITHLFFVISLLSFFILIVWSFTRTWFFPDIFPSAYSASSWQELNIDAIKNTIYIGLLVSFVSLILALFWLEWSKVNNAYLYLTLILPMLPIAISQYHTALFFHLPKNIWVIAWGHLFWVLPYMVLILSAPYRRFNSKYTTVAKTMGYSDFWVCLKIKWPMLIKPILVALSVGFSVSVAQYLPTIFLGAGRVDTIVTEVITLVAGGSRRALATGALIQLLITAAMFIICYLLSCYYSHKRGLK